MHELYAGWQWLEEISPGAWKILKAAGHALADILHRSWICSGDPLNHSVEACERLIEKYAPYSLIAVGILAVAVVANRLGSDRH